MKRTFLKVLAAVLLCITAIAIAMSARQPKLVALTFDDGLTGTSHLM